MFKYETHLHTSPVSKCARENVLDMIKRYKSLGYAGIFITNHFIDGNINIDDSLSYEEKINFYFSDYETGLKIGHELDFSVFLGIELSYKGTDFLIYGLDKKWFLSHPEIACMKKSDELKLMIDAGALVIQAHPFREDPWINHIRLFPRVVHGVEVNNACRKDFENEMAKIYANAYGLIHFAGSDIHHTTQTHLAGVEFCSPISNENDFIERIKNKDFKIFSIDV